MTSIQWINTLSRSIPTRAETVVHQKTSKNQLFLESVKLTGNAGQHGTGHEIAKLFADTVVIGIILVTVIRRSRVQISSGLFFISSNF
jgi:hypothetical protein